MVRHWSERLSIAASHINLEINQSFIKNINQITTNNLSEIETSKLTFSSISPKMKALILVGGYGTRLRPLTFSKPKPLVEFANKAIVVHQIEALVSVGVTQIILAVNVEPQAMESFLKECEQKYKISIAISRETIPMGTAGPLALAADLLTKDNPDQMFFMFNSDVICDFPLKSMLDYHRHHKAEGTIMVTKVSDPSKYGVVVSQENGCIEKFIEKPQTFVSDKINAGIYLFNTAILKRVPNRPTSIERDTFPMMAAESELYSMVLKGYWMDIGQPKDYLSGMVLHLGYVAKTNPSALTPSLKGSQIVGSVLIDPSAKIGNNCRIGPDVIIGPNCVIEDGVSISRTTLLAGTKISSYAFVHSSLIGWESSLGSWSHVVDCVFGKDINVKEGISLSQLIVCPHKGIAESQQAKIIM